MTNEHLCPLLDDARGRKLLFAVGEQVAHAAVSPEVIEMIKGGRLCPSQMGACAVSLLVTLCGVW